MVGSICNGTIGSENYLCDDLAKAQHRHSMIFRTFNGWIWYSILFSSRRWGGSQELSKAASRKVGLNLGGKAIDIAKLIGVVVLKSRVGEQFGRRNFALY